MSSDKHANVATPYAALYLIFRKGGKIAFLLRANTSWMDGHYALPAGRVEKNETFLQAAIREAKEEVGVDIEPANMKHCLTVHRRHPDSQWVDVVFEATSWQGELYNAEPDVHGELSWFDIDALPENTVPNSRFIVGTYASGSGYAEFGWDNAATNS
jgi:8-oxo-dGTP diphosphatase